MCSTLGVAERILVPCPAARTTTAATAPPRDGDDCELTELLAGWGNAQGVGCRWGTRTRTETSRLQRPAGCRLPHPPLPAAGRDVGAGGPAPATSLGPPPSAGT